MNFYERIFVMHPLQIQGGLKSGRRLVVKIIPEYVVPTPLSGIRVGERKKEIRDAFKNVYSSQLAYG
jgi:hypothetical protein